jgi:fructose-specific phosphotransferase system IIC component
VSGGLIVGFRGLISGLIVGLISGLIVGLISGLIAGLQTDIKNRTIPNQGILESAKNGVIIAMIITAVWAFAFILHSLALERTVEPVSAIIFGLGIGLFSGFVFGGVPVVQHCVLRFILWQSGSSPRSYKHFLGYASERGFILQVRGRYRFIHDLLREHFAKMG